MAYVCSCNAATSGGAFNDAVLNDTLDDIAAERDSLIKQGEDLPKITTEDVYQRCTGKDEGNCKKCYKTIFNRMTEKGVRQSRNPANDIPVINLPQPE